MTSPSGQQHPTDDVGLTLEGQRDDVQVLRDRVGTADAVLAIPAGRACCAVLVLAGSSGRIDEARVQLLARAGAVALGLRWFGGDGQPPGICEVPLETFNPALDLLAVQDVPLAILGTSKGAEAALLLAVADSRVSTVVGFAPSDVVWANVEAGRDGGASPLRSSWTRAGRPLPFVPYASNWTPDQTPPAYLGWYLRSREVHAEDVPPATIPVEQFPGTVLLVAGEDDQVWDSAASARRIERRRAASGRQTTVVTHPGAGHRTLLPGESPPTSGQRMSRGGSPAADRELGDTAWPALVSALGLRQLR